MVRWLWVAMINLRRAWANALRRVFVRRVPWVQLRLRGPLPAFTPAVPWWQRRFRGVTPPAGLDALHAAVTRIVEDPRCPGVVLKVGPVGGGWAAVREVHAEVARVRACGKRVVALLAAGDTQSWLCAIAADDVVAPPAVSLMLPGLRREAYFLRDALRRVGVDVEVFQVSPYKSAAETLVRDDFSPENRAQLERILGARMDAMVALAAAARKRPPETVREWFERGILDATSAVAAGALDATCFEDELSARLGGAKPATITTWARAVRMLKTPYARVRGKRVAVVRVHGTITSGKSRELPLPVPLLGAEQAGLESITQALRSAEQDDHVVAVVLHVDSPGGDAVASDLLWREVARVNQAKPVVAYMHNVAASGGYYVALPARRIVATPDVVTGSIGVLAVRPVIAGLLRRADVHARWLQRGDRAGLLSASQALSTAEKETLERSLLHAYDLFLMRTTDGRKKDRDALEPLAGGRVWLGHEALASGLVDETGRFCDAIRTAQEAAHVRRDPDAHFVVEVAPSSALLPRPWPASAIEIARELADEVRGTVAWAVLPFGDL
ncbi:MAG: S49 family peptidase [Deltaproteobacteria bacterium]|nr:S49 family peptidase [Deltaproteobacteria bacterium]